MPVLVAEPLTATAPPPLPIVETHRHAPPAGFWLRGLAHLIDSTLFSMIITPILIGFLMGDIMELAAQAQDNPAAASPLAVIEAMHSPVGLLIQYGLPAIAVILLWRWRSATPGKMILGLVIVDANTLGKPSTAALLVRFFGYIVSMIPLCLGFAWAGWDPHKQAWHDKLARTLVIRTKF